VDPSRLKLSLRMHLIRLLTLIIHAVLSASLLGGMLYSFITVQPRAKVFFKDILEFEAFVANLAHGARQKFLTVLALIAITGLIDPLLSDSARSLLWWTCFGAKCVLWAAILSCFTYVSWRLWPRRVLAAPADLPAIRKDFTVMGRIILSLLLIAFVMGMVMSQIR
jgi:hypothetical protein